MEKVINKAVGFTNSNELYIESREVAAMINMQHKDLIRKIVGISTDLREGNFTLSQYWTESTYKTKGNNKSYRCYLVTRKGCEFLANKTTGKKGNLFTYSYIEKFHEMEQTLKSEERSLTNKDALLLDLFSDDNTVVARAHKELVKLETKPLLETIEQQEEIIESQKDDVEFASAITGNKRKLYGVGEVAKILRLEMGQNKFFALLRDKKILMSSNKKKNQPYQRYVDKGYLELVVEIKEGMIFYVPKFTGAGVDWIRKRINH